MRNQWYGDKRDLIKWGVLVHLVKDRKLKKILQVAYFKLTGRRIFKVSPFHHHFEHTTGINYAYLLPKLEWAEPKITIRLWILQVLFVGLAIIAARI